MTTRTNLLATLLAIALLTLAAGGCRNYRNKASREGQWDEGKAPVTVSPKIEKQVRLANFDTSRTPEGRLEVRVTLENRGKNPITVLVYTDFLDMQRNIKDRSIDVPIVIPSGTTKLYEDKSFAMTGIESFSVSVRPANTVRRTR